MPEQPDAPRAPQSRKDPPLESLTQAQLISMIRSLRSSNKILTGSLGAMRADLALATAFGSGSGSSSHVPIREAETPGTGSVSGRPSEKAADPVEVPDEGDKQDKRPYDGGENLPATTGATKDAGQTSCMGTSESHKILADHGKKLDDILTLVQEIAKQTRGKDPEGS